MVKKLGKNVDKIREMQKSIQLILFTILLFNLSGCLDDNIPTNRPIFAVKDNNLSAIDDIDPTEDSETDSLVEESRPSGAIIIQSGQCVCEGNKAVSIGNCSSVCSQKNATDETRTLYFDVQLTQAITLDIYEDVAGWCSIQEGETFEKQCAIEAKDESGNTELINFTPAPGQTSFSVNVDSLNNDETYRISIVETSTEARSTAVQIRMVSELIEDDVGGPLALMPVNQFTCLFREGEFDEDTGDLFNNDVSRFHFYFISETRPEPLRESSLSTVACHDYQTYGNTPINSPLLEETTDSFTVWNRMDPRFFDLDDNNILKVHELIQQNLELQGQSVSSPPELFFELEWPSGIDDGDAASGSDGQTTSLTTISSKMGMYMTPFLDTENNYTAYCPTQEHYYSDSPLFKALREIVAIDTEGLYVAKQDNVCDFLLVKESLIKQIWFYIEGGLHIAPTNETIRNKKIQFYWPADTSSPYVKKSHQRIYTLKGSDEISCGSNNVSSNSGQDSSGTRTNYPPHDKRIGCIPVLK